MSSKYKQELSLRVTTGGWSVGAIDLYHGLKEVVGSGPKVLKGLINISRSVWHVTVCNEGIKEKLLEDGLIVNGEVCKVQEIDSDKLLIKVKAPLEIPNERISAEMAKYGLVVSIENETYQFDRSLENGVRRVWMKDISKPLPSTLSIDNTFFLPLWYRGQIKTCRICTSTDHLASACPHKDKCLICGSTDHYKWRCKEATKNQTRSASEPKNHQEPEPAAVAAVYKTATAADVHKPANPVVVDMADSIEVLSENVTQTPVPMAKDVSLTSESESLQLGQTRFRSQSTESADNSILDQASLTVTLKGVEGKTDIAVGASKELTSTSSSIPRKTESSLKRQKDDSSSDSDVEEDHVHDMSYDYDDSVSVADSDISVSTQSSQNAEMVMYRSETGQVLIPYITKKGVRYRQLRNDSDVSKYQHLTVIELNTSEFNEKIGKWAKKNLSKKNKSN